MPYSLVMNRQFGEHRAVESGQDEMSLVDQPQQIDMHLCARIGALRQAILKKAFSGRLVAQDPNDEPASVLLRRGSGREGSSNKQKDQEGRGSRMNTASIVSKVWSFCTTLRDDGVGLRRLPGAAHLSDLPEDGGRIREAALQPQCRHSCRIRLAKPEVEARRGAGGPLRQPCCANWAAARACWARFSPRRRTRFRTRPSSIA